MCNVELIDRVFRHAANGPGRAAYHEAARGSTLTYGDLATGIRAISALAASRRGDRRTVMLRCENRVEYPIWFLALLSCGADVVPVSAGLTETEQWDAATRAGVTAVVSGGSIGEALRKGVADVWPVDLALGAAIGKTAPGPQSERRPAGDLLLASSGTTGVPKVVRRSAASLDAVSRNMVEAIGYCSEDHVLAAVPLTHSYGLEHGLLAPLWAGSTVHLCAGFDLPTVAQTLAAGATILPAVPSMIEMLAVVIDAKARAPRLRAAFSAGGPLPVAVAERFERRFGVRVGQVYGMTEIGSVTYNDGSAEPFDAASVGRAMRDVSIRIRDVNPPHAPRATGEEGEVLVRAPSMFDAYLGDETPLIDGHFPTGDLGHLDASGQLTITGRARLLIDAGGMKVNPAEVEAVIASHPGVLECVVVPMRQTETVQRLRAFVVLRDMAVPPTGDDLRRFARERLAGYKVPRVVEFPPSLPRNAAGKVQRRLLEER